MTIVAQGLCQSRCESLPLSLSLSLSLCVCECHSGVLYCKCWLAVGLHVFGFVCVYVSVCV